MKLKCLTLYNMDRNYKFFLPYFRKCNYYYVCKKACGLSYIRNESGGMKTTPVKAKRFRKCIRSSRFIF